MILNPVLVASRLVCSVFSKFPYGSVGAIRLFKFSKFIHYDSDQIFFDTFHISFIVYDLDEEELLLTSTQDVDFKKLGETLPRKINNLR